jgi:hypothetical protein
VLEVVRVQGVLQGMDREADCGLITWKERSTSGRVYTRCRIVDEPPDLPEGPYTLSFARHTVPTRKFDGCWTLTFLPPGIDIERAA